MAIFYGADVSEWQGPAGGHPPIDWQAFNPGAAFVWIKATGGDGPISNPLYMDAQLHHNKEGVRSLGNAMPHGYFHFAGGRLDPEIEADYFVDNGVNDLQVGEAVALDWEVELTDPVSWCKRFKDRIESRLGFHMILYVDSDRLLRYNFSPILDTSPLWEANYGYTPDEDIPGSPTYTFHQYRDNGTFPGIEGNVDVDAFFANDINDFFKLGKPAPVVPVPPVPQPEPPVLQPIPKPSPPIQPSVPDPGTVIVPTPPLTPTPTPGPIINDPLLPVPRPKPVPLPIKKTQCQVIEVTLMQLLGRYNKFFVAVSGLFVTFLLQHYGSNSIVKDVVMLLTAAGVYQAKNEP